MFVHAFTHPYFLSLLGLLEGEIRTLSVPITQDSDALEEMTPSGRPVGASTDLEFGEDPFNSR